MNPLLSILIIIAGLGFGGMIGFYLYNRDLKNLSLARDRAQKTVLEAKKRSDQILSEAKEQARVIREMLKSDEENWHHRQETLIETIELKDQTQKRKLGKNLEINAYIQAVQKEIEILKSQYAEIEGSLMKEVEKNAGVSAADMKITIMRDLEADIVGEKDIFIMKQENEVKDELFRIAKKVVLYVIQRFSGSTSVERNNTNVVIPKEIMKGMLIGKQGVNIAFLESLFPGLQFIFEHEPKTLTISGFNLLQRNIAALTVKKLLRKRSISPAEIRSTQKIAKDEVDIDIMKEGKKALKQVGIEGCSDRLIWLVGRLKFRTSYRQNILKHSIEMAFFAEMIASEIGADTHIAKVATFFHDIGKAVDHDFDTDEGHDFLTKEILEESGFDQDIVHAAYAHHDAEPQRIPEAFIVKAADAISGGRPGARQETLDSYLDRIIRLEELTGSIEGVKKTYAVAAGREVRLFVDPQLIKDGDMETIAGKAAKDIEENLIYPGKIKVNVIRTLKATEVAK